MYIHSMTFDVMSAEMSYPQLEVSFDVECMSLDYAFSYDVILTLFNMTTLLQPMAIASSITGYRNLQGHSSLTLM